MRASIDEMHLLYPLESRTREKVGEAEAREGLVETRLWRHGRR
jgi:hypothetical protein